MTMVPVYEFLNASGQVQGLGTALELAHWQAEGVMPADDRLGKVLTHEPASEDERRKAAWASPLGQLGKAEFLASKGAAA